MAGLEDEVKQAREAEVAARETRSQVAASGAEKDARIAGLQKELEECKEKYSNGKEEGMKKQTEELLWSQDEMFKLAQELAASKYDLGVKTSELSSKLDYIKGLQTSVATRDLEINRLQEKMAGLEASVKKLQLEAVESGQQLESRESQVGALR